MYEARRMMDQIIGNNALKVRLCRDILSDSLSHAYIIEGQEGSGRKSIALMSAAASACSHKNDPSFPVPCMECVSCKKILERKSPDVIFVGTNGKASVGVDTTRFLKEDVHVIPNDLDHKFYIIEDADKMTPQAQNALLLTLEEPPSFVHFFLICADTSLMLETIRSRAPTLKTEPIDDSILEEFICSRDTRAAQMKLSSPAEFEELIKASDMSIGKALSLLDTKANTAAIELRSFVKSFISAAVDKKSAKTIIPMLLTFSSKRDILSKQLSLVAVALRDLILLKKSDDSPLCFYANKDTAIELCDKVSITFLFNFYNAISEAISENQRNANVKLLMTKMAVSANII